MDASQASTQQATQTVLDPRRLGKQNSGFSDEDISDIICLLLPQTDNARDEVARIAKDNPQYVVGRENADLLELDYSIEDAPERFGSDTTDTGKLAIALRLSAKVKSPLQGFTFGRNSTRCDFVLVNDPCRRLSNIHFRIYINEYGVLMIEDQSTNGTIVDNVLLKARTKTPHNVMRTLNSGSRISLLSHTDSKDVAFLVRIPRREGDYEVAYRKNLIAYRHGLDQLAQDLEQTITAGPEGHVVLFPHGLRRPRIPAPKSLLVNEITQENADRVSRDWMGSDRYNRIGPIGKGAFATVHKVTAKFDGKPYAAKELDKKRFMKNGVLDQKVDNEMKIMQQITHPNIVRYVEHFEWEDRLLIIIMEYVKGGDLGHLVESRGPLSEDAVKVMARQLLEALSYLHGKNITHRDVKPDNILIESESPFVVKLTDFGLSKMVDTEQTFLRTFCGTLLYCAPEVYSEYREYDEFGRRNPRNKKQRSAPGPRYSHAVDIWSLGGVLFYSLCGKPPFPVAKGTSYTELLYQIMTRGVDIGPLILAGVSSDGNMFIQEMLQRHPGNRASVDELLEHPWLCVQSPSRSQAISDEALQFKASQLSLVENRQPILPPLSDDEILDDEEDFDDLKFLQDSQKENITFGAPQQPPRLFGEVNVSAIGSSGVIPEGRLNLPIRNASLGQSDIESESEIEDSFESQFSPVPGAQGVQAPSSGGAQHESQSVDELNNLTFDASSQSLGGAESILGNLHMKSAPGTTRLSFNELNTSKRKPSFDTSDELGDVSTTGKPTFKRLRSESRIEVVPDADDDDLPYTQVPAISRDRSARQIDTPVHKSQYWTPGDTASYHLRYPEMTQLQHEAFVRGALARREEFRPGKSVLWNLAMKYFPPAGQPAAGPVASPADDGSDRPGEYLGSTADDDIPSTFAGAVDAPWNSASLILGSTTAAPPKTRNSPKLAAILESVPGSAIPGLSISITESMTSWGRGPKNTRRYDQKLDTRISKCAFKIILWKEGFDPSKDIRPWNRPTVSDEMNFHFYISTKATEGIRVNGIDLRSHEAQNPSSASKFWIKLFDGDVVTVWRNTDHRRPPGKIVFRCTWGGSSLRRPETSLGDLPPPPLVPDAISRRLDDACLKTERRLEKQSEQDLKMAEADVDADERRKNIDRERRRSDVFEARRAEACKARSARISSQS